MKYRIGFITTDYYVNDWFYKTIDTISDRCEVNLIVVDNFDTYTKLINIYNENVKKYDAFVCSGVIAYSMLKENIENIAVPMDYLSLGDKDFYKYIFKELIEDRTLDISKMFMDFLRLDNNYYDIYSLIDYEKCPYTIRDFDINQPARDFKVLNDTLLDIHLDLWKRNKITLSITRNYIISTILNDLGYKCVYMSPSAESILNTFTNVLNKLELERLDKNKLATGIITIDSNEYCDEKFVFDNDDILNRLCNMVSDLLNKIGFYNIQVIKNSMKIEMHTTKDTLFKLTNGYRDFFIDDILDNISYSINIGWGIGNTKTHSESNARNANIKSAELGGNCTFVIDDTNRLIGPLYSENKIINASDSVIVERLASYIPLSSTNISKIMSIVDERGTNEITAKILSDYLNVTLRTANRILGVLYESNVATLVDSTGSKKHRGRPEKVYQINFSNILNQFTN